jgi:hypothetical protein
MADYGKIIDMAIDWKKILRDKDIEQTWHIIKIGTKRLFFK